MDRSPTHTMTPSHQQLQRCTIQLRPRSRSFPNEPLHLFLVVRWRVPNLQILPLSLSHSSFIACTCPYDWQVWIFRCLENVTNAVEFVFNPPTVLSSRHPPQKFPSNQIITTTEYCAHHSWSTVHRWKELQQKPSGIKRYWFLALCIVLKFPSLANGWLVHSRQQSA